MAYALSNRECEQLFPAPPAQVSQWIGVIPAFQYTAGGLGLNTSSHEVCEEVVVAGAGYVGRGEWNEATESCMILRHMPPAGFDDTTDVRPTLTIVIPELESRSFPLLVKRLGMRTPPLSSAVLTSPINVEAAIHTVSFASYPRYACCPGYELQAPAHGSVCGLPSGVATYSKTFPAPTTLVNGTRTYVIPSIPCVIDSFTHTRYALGTEVLPTHPPTAVNLSEVWIPIVGGNGQSTFVVAGTLTAMPNPWAHTVGGLMIFLFISAATIFLEVRWRKQAQMRLVTPCTNRRDKAD